MRVFSNVLKKGENMKQIKLVSLKNIIFVLVVTIAFAVTFHWCDSKMAQAIEDNKETMSTSEENKSEEAEEPYDKQLYAELQRIAVEEQDVIHFVRTINKPGYEQAISEMEVAIKRHNDASNYEARVQMDVNKLDSCVQIEITSNKVKDRDFPVTELGQTALVLPSTIMWKDCYKESISTCVVQENEEEIGRTVQVVGVAYLSENDSIIHMLDDKSVTKIIDREREYKLFIDYDGTYGWVLPDRVTRNGVISN